MTGAARPNFEFLPHWRKPFDFFLAAPLWGGMAGILLFLGGIEHVMNEQLPWVSRWYPAIIALVHCWVLGVATQIMLGALHQVLPVLGGKLLRGGSRATRLFFSGFNAGLLLLVGGLLFDLKSLLNLAALLIPMALLWFAVQALGAIPADKRLTSSLFAVLCALVALLVTLLLGSVQLAGHSGLLWPAVVFDREWTSIHLLWGLGGWMGLLIMGVSYQVVPMFHVTPALAERRQRAYPLWVMVAFVSASVAWLWWPQSLLAGMSRWLGVGIFGCFAMDLGQALRRRKRKLQDVSVAAWWTGIGAYLFFMLLMALRDTGMALNVSAEVLARLESGMGVVLIFGVILSVVLGMQLKILPFLSYLHMQRACGSDFAKIRLIPNTREILPDRIARFILHLHWFNLMLLLLVVLYFPFALVAGPALLVEFGVLAMTSLRVHRMLTRHLPA